MHLLRPHLRLRSREWLQQRGPRHVRTITYTLQIPRQASSAPSTRPISTTQAQQMRAQQLRSPHQAQHQEYSQTRRQNSSPRTNAAGARQDQGTTGVQGLRKVKRPGWYTAAFAIVAAVGALYGAGLKSNTQAQERREQLRALSAEETRTQLLEARKRLVATQAELEGKIEGLRVRQAQRRARIDKSEGEGGR